MKQWFMVTKLSRHNYGRFSSNPIPRNNKLFASNLVISKIGIVSLNDHVGTLITPKTFSFRFKNIMYSLRRRRRKRKGIKRKSRNYDTCFFISF